MHEALDRLDHFDRRIINQLQDGFPICERPFAAAAQSIGLSEQELLERVAHLLRMGVLSRFGPLYQIERGGGAYALAAMQVAEQDIERVAEYLNAMPEVAHNYLRDHRFNVWFVLATASQHQIDLTVDKIEKATGYEVLVLPKLREYFLDLRLPV
jgi:siroheme decarboxylase